MMLPQQSLFSLLVPCCATLASAKDTVIHGAQVIRDQNLYAEAVHVDFGDEASPGEALMTLRLMLRLETLVIGGSRFTDSDLANLTKRKSLRTLVLDSVDITDKVLAEFPTETTATVL